MSGSRATVRRMNSRRTARDVRRLLPALANVPAKLVDNFGHEPGENRCQAASGAAEIGQGQNDAGADDADADLADSARRQVRRLRLHLLRR